ncbi:lysylphosphatidylglycerol synthase domain-containing protein [Nocardioides taihuensis]|uniref:Lysylphosphatidylglycerol synthase domain-containing protein n=1 Tax=Nocardioides taihuensis TaxID=1835606 RepID=A0ABW0BNY1_9ACTN
MHLPERLRAVLHSRALLVVGVLVSIVVPAVTLPRLPSVTLWPLLLGLLPWVVGKYLLCPLRWQAITGPGPTRGWFVRTYAESELLGLLTPGHVGADVWRVTSLCRTGLSKADSVLSVGLDRLVGALGLMAFVVFAGPSLPARYLLIALGVALAVVAGALVVRRLRPGLLPRRALPPPKALALGLLLSAGYQLSIAALLWGSVAATGNSLTPLALLGAFGASQLAGVLPGPNGASPRDGALVAALAALGVPWAAAAAAVTLKAAVAWLPALLLGGASLVLTRRALRAAAAPVPVPA